MSTTEVPINRTLVGCLSIGCLISGGLLVLFMKHDASQMWSGAFIRVGVVLAALWMALPTRTREAAWARVPLWKVAGTVLGILLIIRSRIPLQMLIPAGIVIGGLWILFRPRSKDRPRPRGVR